MRTFSNAVASSFTFMSEFSFLYRNVSVECKARLLCVDLDFKSLEGAVHRAIIDEHAKEGHRFVAMIPTLEGANGKTLAFDLVFEVDE